MPRNKWLPAETRRTAEMVLIAGAMIEVVKDIEEKSSKRRKRSTCDEDVDDGDDDGVLVLATAAAIMAEPVRTLVLPDRRIDFFEDWGADDCDNFWCFTHFRREELQRLTVCFHLPAVIKVGPPKHQTSFDCFDALVIVLLRYASGDTLVRLASWVGWADTQLSAIINWMIRYVFSKCAQIFLHLS